MTSRRGWAARRRVLFTPDTDEKETFPETPESEEKEASNGEEQG